METASSVNVDRSPEHCTNAGWTRLPAALVAHAGSFLPDAQSLLALVNSCSTWCSIPDQKFDAAWRAVYLAEFEPESANDSIIAVDGAETPWRKRVAARVRVESNWRNGRVSNVARTMFKAYPGVAMIARLGAAVFDSGSRLMILDARSCNEVRSWTLPSRIGASFLPCCASLLRCGQGATSAYAWTNQHPRF